MAVGAVLVHGFTGTPYELHPLTAALRGAGIQVDTPLLPGHGTSPADLARTRWTEWRDTVEHALDAMAARTGRVVVIGQSLGGLLALELATRRHDAALAGVASLAAPLWFEGITHTAVRATRLGGPLAWLRTVPKLGGSDVRDRGAKRGNASYRAVPVAALRELVAVQAALVPVLPRVTCPVLVMHARHDHTAPVASAAHIAAATRAERLRILLHSFHLIAMDVEREIVATEALAFLARRG